MKLPGGRLAGRRSAADCLTAKLQAITALREEARLHFEERIGGARPSGVDLSESDVGMLRALGYAVD